jgi:CRP-like cAMP-binding protein
LKEDYINTIGKGEMFGEIAVIDNGLTTASVVASAEVVLMQFEKENLLELLRRNTNITLSIINTTSKRIAHTIQKRNLSA